jgi:hypothetical protein
MDIFDIIEKWDLSNPKLDFSKWSRKNISLMANEIENIYNNHSFSISMRNRIHMPITDSVRIMEAKNELSDLTYPLILSQELWLPDPLYSLFSISANSLWQRIPEGGAKGFASTPMIRIEWKNYWSTRISDRANFINKIVPILVNNLLKIKELYKLKYINIYPWEKIIENKLMEIKSQIIVLKSNENIEKEITQRYRQKYYSLGVRLGSIDVAAAEDFPPEHKLKKGDPLWIGDKTEIFFVGIVNTIITSLFESNMYEYLPGDRLIHDYIRTGGKMININDKPKIKREIPDFKYATWDNIVDIKKDSELLNNLTEIISEFSYGDDENLNQNLKDRLFEIADQIKSSKDLKKYIKAPLIELGVGTLGGFVANVITGLDVNTSLISTSIITGSTFLYSLVSDFFKAENQMKRKRKDVMLKIADKI